MRDGFFKSSIKFVARMIFNIDLAINRRFKRMQKDTPYKLGGSCQLCAKCCESPMVQTSAMFFRLPSLKALFLAWHRHVNGFELQEERTHQRFFVFKCTHFDWESRRCDSYHSRPGMCRDYPRALLWEANPPFLDGCGYKAIDPKAESWQKIIDQENLPEEKRRELEKKLFIKED